ncbi:hypothetical protein GNX71_19420 [Variovorax sp. RKNM96]|uniref:hypothetical protein n=1 Tax=Variovorax sp. RKNM96 TaxID=2681552 RepID=UPI001AF76C1B|nr:hypothetical protein [Variovorax sp. RKNM96]QSI31631.1 hypothetical protein GNX71_19420 [Variovorax sp. RKNM96]
MPPTDTFVRHVKHKSTEIGERYADGGGMHPRVKAAGKYWHSVAPLSTGLLRASEAHAGPIRPRQLAVGVNALEACQHSG